MNRIKRVFSIFLIIAMASALTPTLGFAADIANIQKGTDLSAGAGLAGTQVYFGE